MLFKYPFIIEGFEKEFAMVESKFMKALEELDFVDDVDYDGNYLTVLVSEQKKGIASENQSILNAKVSSVISAYC